MGDRRWLYEQVSGAAPTNGQALVASTALSDTGAQMQSVTAGTGGSVVYSNEWSLPAGGFSVKMTNQASGSGGTPNQIRWAPDVWSNIFAIDKTFRWSVAPATTRLFLRARYGTTGVGAGNGYIFSIARRPDHKMEIQNASGVLVTGGLSSVALPLTAVRVEAYGVLASGANSNLTVKFYDSTGALLDTVSLTNIDLGATGYSIACWEAFNSGADVVSLYVDSPGVRALSSGTPTPMGAYTTSLPPALAGSVGGGLAMIDARSSTGSNVFTMTIAPQPDTGVTATKIVDGVWIIPQTASPQVWRVTGTDSVNGLSSTKDFTVPAKTVSTSQRLVKTPTGAR